MMKGGDSTYVANDVAVPLNLLIYWCVIGQSVTSRHGVLVCLLVPGLREFKK